MSDQNYSFPDTLAGWRAYNRDLGRRGQEAGGRLRRATDYAERVALEEEYELIVQETRAANAAFRAFRQAEEAREFVQYVELSRKQLRRLLLPTDLRPKRDLSRHSLTEDEIVDGMPTGQPVGLDTAGERLRQEIAGREAAPAGEAMRLSHTQAGAVISMLEEFALQLMARQDAGQISEGDTYVQAILELAMDLRGGPFDS